MKDIDFEQALYDHFGQVKDFTLGMRIGKYFYELGCRRTAEKYDEIEYNRQREEESVPNDLEEAAMNYIAPIENEDGLKIINFSGQDIKNAFIDGAKWQKEQMMQEAVEGKVFMSFAPGHNQMVMADVDLPTNTKVRIIIVKED